MLEAKYPLPKGQQAFVLQMNNPYLLLNQQSFEAAGVGEEEAENTTRAMVEKIFTGFALLDSTSCIGPFIPRRKP